MSSYFFFFLNCLFALKALCYILVSGLLQEPWQHKQKKSEFIIQTHHPFCPEPLLYLGKQNFRKNTEKESKNLNCNLQHKGLLIDLLFHTGHFISSLVQIRPYVGCLVQYLPLLWKQSEEHNMLRCAILTTLIHLVQVWSNSCWW